MPDLIECARRGEPDAQRILVMVTHAIVDAVQIVAQSYDPRMIIFGGGMAKTGQPLIDVTLDELRVRERTCPFLTGRVGRAGGLIGTPVPATEFPKPPGPHGRM